MSRLLGFCCIAILFQVCFGSYLDLPRIHFAGNFRADPDTGNNMNCFYVPNYKPDFYYDFNSNGTNEFAFTDTDITGVDYVSSSTANENQDPVLSAIIVNNLNRPFAKMVDLDADASSRTTIYGMKMGISWGQDDTGKHDLAFMGTWTRSIISQQWWRKFKCYDGEQEVVWGSQGTTTLTDVEWGNLKNSPALQQLKDAYESGSKKLSVRVSYYYYTDYYVPLVPTRFTLGKIIGTVGVYNEGETLNVAGERLLTYYGASNPVLNFSTTDSCHGHDVSEYTPWTGFTPFKLRNENGKEVVIDFSNGLPINTDGTQRCIGELYIGYRDTTAGCIQIIEPDKPIPYMETEWQQSGSISVYSLTEAQYTYLLSNALIVIQKIQGSGGESLCGGLPSSDTETGIVVLQEREYFIRPMGYCVDRLEYNENNVSKQTLLVTRFGQPVSVNVTISQSNPDALPEAAVLPDMYIKESDESGHVTFNFVVSKSIPYPRQYKTPVNCSNVFYSTIPIDGQVYYFVYCVSNPGTSDCKYNELSPVSNIVFRVFSTVNYQRPYTWVDDVEPIFSQYAQVAVVMKSIFNMSNYTEVYYSTELIKHSMSLDTSNPNYMPATRDLSPTKIKMILEWLDNPRYSKHKDKPDNPGKETCQYPPSSDAIPDSDIYFNPPRCLLKSIPVSSDIRDTDIRFEHIFKPNNKLMANFKANIKPRPLFGFLQRLKQNSNTVCDLQDLKDQLRLAMQLEFYTIPLYLTTLYSIADGCNQQTYSAIRNVVMQEMMHFAQSTNILISIGGIPVIDDESFAPTYPHLGLPGGVLPNLYVTLEKLSLQHVYNVFMGVEVPAETWVGGDHPEYANNTIGQFYEEIQKCIKSLPTTIFDPSSVAHQVSWPWNAADYVGKLLKVNSTATALLAIEQIVVQGEGASPYDPNSTVHGEYAHFYRFEEIVCQKGLVYNPEDNSYSYSGNPIPFDPLGVWQMRNNPKSGNIKNDTNCHTESMAFHHVYRAFLRKLDETFTPCKASTCPSPQSLLLESIELMEALQVHAKKLMWVKLDFDNPDDTETCGPVWDYNFN